MMHGPGWESGLDCSTSTALEQLEETLRLRLGRRVRDLRLVEREGAIVLSGQANTYYAKQLAQETFMLLTGTRWVVNDIEVI